MSKRKGLSLDDKRDAILDIYHEQLQPMNLKEIENFGSKRGVVQQTIKDVNQSLVDDFLIQSDKIGSSNFFWSFPSKAYNDKLNEKSRLEKLEKTLIERNADLQKKIDERKRETSRPDRGLLIAKYNALLSEDKELSKKLEDNKLNDPEQLKTLEKQINEVVEGANRWTDNIWNVKRYFTKKKGMSSKEVDKLLRITSDFDYVTSEIPSSKRSKK